MNWLLTELTKSLEYTQDQLDNELKIFKTGTKNLGSAVKEIEQKIEEYPNIKNSLIEHEHRSRRNNIYIHGIVEASSKTWEECLK